MGNVNITPTTHTTDGSQFYIADQSNMYTDANSTTRAAVSSYSYDSNSHFILLKGFDFSQVPSGMTVTSYSIYVNVEYAFDINHSSEAYPKLYNGSTQLGASATVDSEGPASYQYKFVFSNPISWDTLSGYGSNFAVGVNFKKINAYTGSTLKIYGAHIDVEYSESTESNSLYVKSGSTWVEATSAYVKINGSWVEQDISTVFDTTKNYVKGN